MHNENMFLLIFFVKRRVLLTLFTFRVYPVRVTLLKIAMFSLKMCLQLHNYKSNWIFIQVLILSR